jgi:hypothetical protein
MTKAVPRLTRDEWLDAYWRARSEFERVLCLIPPDIIKSRPDQIAQVLADIDIGALERPRRRGAKSR